MCITLWLETWKDTHASLDINPVAGVQMTFGYTSILQQQSGGKRLLKMPIPSEKWSIHVHPHTETYHFRGVLKLLNDFNGWFWGRGTFRRLVSAAVCSSPTAAASSKLGSCGGKVCFFFFTHDGWWSPSSWGQDLHKFLWFRNRYLRSWGVKKQAQIESDYRILDHGLVIQDGNFGDQKWCVFERHRHTYKKSCTKTNGYKVQLKQNSWKHSNLHVLCTVSPTKIDYPFSHNHWFSGKSPKNSRETNIGGTHFPLVAMTMGGRVI